MCAYACLGVSLLRSEPQAQHSAIGDGLTWAIVKSGFLDLFNQLFLFDFLAGGRN